MILSLQRRMQQWRILTMMPGELSLELQCAVLEMPLVYQEDVGQERYAAGYTVMLLPSKSMLQVEGEGSHEVLVDQLEYYSLL